MGFSYTHGGAVNRLVEQGVVEKGEDDFGMSCFNSSFVELVLTDAKADMAYQALLLHLLQLVKGAAEPQRIFDFNRIVDQYDVEIVHAQR